MEVLNRTVESLRFPVPGALFMSGLCRLRGALGSVKGHAMLAVQGRRPGARVYVKVQRYTSESL